MGPPIEEIPNAIVAVAPMVVELVEMLVVEFVDGNVCVELDDVVVALLLQDAITRNGRMRTQIANRYNLLFILSSLFTIYLFDNGNQKLDKNFN